MNAQSTGGATIGAVAVPSAEALYLQAVVDRLAAILGEG